MEIHEKKIWELDGEFVVFSYGLVREALIHTTTYDYNYILTVERIWLPALYRDRVSTLANAGFPFSKEEWSLRRKRGKNWVLLNI